MGFLLGLSGAIDRLSAWAGRLAAWCVLIACLISAGNALSRYAFGASSNAWLEIQWYLFAAMVLLGAAHTLRVNEHVRVDIVYGALPARGRIWVDLVGGVLFLLPSMAMIGWMSWSYFAESFAIGEMSNNAGGLPRWPVKLLLPLGFALLTAQGLSEVIKRVAVLTGRAQAIPRYGKPAQ